MTGLLEGRVAIVTGAGRGIGLATATRLAEEGAQVAVVDVVADRVDAAVAHIGAHAVGAVCDVADADQVRRVIEELHTGLGRIDILVNNAGIAVAEPFLEARTETWDRTMTVNLRGQFVTGQAVARHMVADGRGGAIVNVSSTNGLLGEAELVHYNASKAGVLLLSKTMAIELAGHAIRVNSICPGFILTELAYEAGEDPDSIRRYGEKIPMGRVGRASEVADAIVFLASEKASFITGAELVVDGGQICQE